MTTTTIQSRAHDSVRSVDVIVRDDGLVNLNIKGAYGGFGIQIRLVELLAALDAAPNSDVDVWKAGAEAAEAKLAEAEDDAVAANLTAEGYARDLEAASAKLERVRAIRNEWSKTIGRTGIVSEIDAALADPKPFELPVDKDYGASFWAKNAAGKWLEFVVCKDYSDPGSVPRTVYATRSHAIYTADGIMHWFRDHTNEKPAEA
jgi:hypothetical protein